jgi:hypothetical protein
MTSAYSVECRTSGFIALRAYGSISRYKSPFFSLQKRSLTRNDDGRLPARVVRLGGGARFCVCVSDGKGAPAGRGGAEGTEPLDVAAPPRSGGETPILSI